MLPDGASFALFPTAIAITYVLTGVIRRFAIARAILDIPNERSSHRVPTPRGGGLAFVLTFLACIPLLYALELLDSATSVGLWGAGAAVAYVGFLDDRRHVPVRWRLAAHFASAAWVFIWFGGIPEISIFGYSLPSESLGLLLVTLYLVWLINLYNFMDGIDGIAGIESMTVCFGAALLAFLFAPNTNAWALPLLVLCTVTGFIFWNFPPAKIFMGDVGSGYLGLVLGAMSLHAAQADPRFFWSWLILLGTFIVDATVTLLRRLLRGEKVHVAHRSHAYQYASRKYGAHLPVTLSIAAINLAWLLPLALIVGSGRLDGIIGLGVAYAPLVWLAYHFKAGVSGNANHVAL